MAIIYVANTLRHFQDYFDCADFSGGDPAWGATRFGVRESSGWARTPDMVLPSRWWMHFNVWGHSGDVEYVNVVGHDAAGNVRFHYQGQGGKGNITALYDNGSGLIPLDCDAKTENTIDIEVDGDAGRFAVYVDKMERGAVTGVDLSRMSEIRYFRIYVTYRGSTNAYGYFNEFVISDSPTVMLRVKQSYPTADGTYTEWSGSYADVDEVGINLDDALRTTAAGRKSSVTFDPRNFTNMKVAALVPAFAGMKGDKTAPKSVRSFLRIGGSDYANAAHTMGYGYSNHFRILQNNPATGAPWTIQDAADPTLEVGVESLAEEA